MSFFFILYGAYKALLFIWQLMPLLLYVLRGEPKCWYSVPGNEANSFEKVIVLHLRYGIFFCLLQWYLFWLVTEKIYLFS